MTMRDRTPDSHSFPTRPYDLVKEFVLALAFVTVLTIVLAAVFSSPDRKAITLSDWANAAPSDFVATASAELDGSSGTAGYGPPYNHASDGQNILGVPTQKLLGVRIPIDAPNDFVVDPLKTVTGNAQLSSALQQWSSATPDQQTAWASAYTEALGAAPDGDPAKVASGDYGPVPVMTQSLLGLAKSGQLQGLLDPQTFYATDSTKTLLFLADGTYLEDQARADMLGGDQWGMMNEVGNYPGQPWLTPMTFFYQVEPFASSDNADALIWGLMGLISLLMLLVPFIPGLRSVPKALGLYKLVWRDAYRMRR